MSAVQAPLAESERLRLLAVMGVDVYVPRTAPLARAIDQRAAQAPQLPALREQHPVAGTAAAKVVIGGVRRDEHPRLLAAVMRAAGLRAGEWTFGAGGSLPVWRFGAGATAAAVSPAMTFPPLAELRESIAARRGTWRQLRARLRQR